jgi:holin-like protein
MIRGFAILLLLQFVGEMVSTGLNLPIPGNVLGMGLLLLALNLKLVRSQWVEDAAELLLSHLALFFVPAGVGVMVYFDLLTAEWLPIMVSTVLSTFVVMAVTGWVAKSLEKAEASGDG